MSIDRVVALLTPLFAALAGLITTVISRAVPGVNLNKADVTALFIAGSLTAGGAALKWLHGKQKLEQGLANADQLADHVVAKINANPLAAPALDHIEDLLKAHTAQIVDAVGSAVHAPPSVEQVAQAIIAKAAQGAASPLVAEGAAGAPAGGMVTPTGA
jgi:hypothetical protein